MKFTHFETVVLQLLCKILMRALQAPGARGTLQDTLYINQVMDSLKPKEEANE